MYHVCLACCHHQRTDALPHAACHVIRRSAIDVLSLFLLLFLSLSLSLSFLIVPEDGWNRGGEGCVYMCECRSSCTPGDTVHCDWQALSSTALESSGTEMTGSIWLVRPSRDPNPCLATSSTTVTRFPAPDKPSYVHTHILLYMEQRSWSSARSFPFFSGIPLRTWCLCLLHVKPS